MWASNGLLRSKTDEAFSIEYWVGSVPSNIAVKVFDDPLIPPGLMFVFGISISTRDRIENFEYCSHSCALNLCFIAIEHTPKSVADS